jgi:hypothetical protein
MMILRSIALLAALADCAFAFIPGHNRLQDMSLQAAKKDIESLRKKEFVSIMAEELGTTKTDAEAALACALDLISDVSVESFVGLSVCSFQRF